MQSSAASPSVVVSIGLAVGTILGAKIYQTWIWLTGTQFNCSGEKRENIHLDVAVLRIERSSSIGEWLLALGVISVILGILRSRWIPTASSTQAGEGPTVHRDAHPNAAVLRRPGAAAHKGIGCYCVSAMTTRGMNASSLDILTLVASWP